MEERFLRNGNGIISKASLAGLAPTLECELPVLILWELGFLAVSAVLHSKASLAGLVPTLVCELQVLALWEARLPSEFCGVTFKSFR